MCKFNKFRKMQAAALLALIAIIFLFMVFCRLINAQASAWHDSKPGVIVIDAGHGGVDGGASREGVLEKNVNLSIALKLKAHLERKGYTIVMTRDKDVSLDNLNHSSSSRHKRDLIARAGIISKSAAQIFISVHVNSLASNPAENGSIVYYSRCFPQSKALADYMQKQLNRIKINGAGRKQHRPLVNKYYILSCSRVPGVLIETAFLTNTKEKELLKTEAFADTLAASIAEGADRFLKSESGFLRRIDAMGCSNI